MDHKTEFNSDKKPLTESELLALSDPHIIAAHQRAQGNSETFTPASDLP